MIVDGLLKMSSEQRMSFVGHGNIISLYDCNSHGLHFKEYDTQILGENFMMALNKFYYNAFSYIPDKEHIVFLENPQTN